MKISISRGKRCALVIAVLIFGLWWFLQSWVAYRHVKPSVELTREHVVLPIRQMDPKDVTEQNVILDAWHRGALDMNEHLVGHFWIIVWCLLALAVLALVPETNGRQDK